MPVTKQLLALVLVAAIAACGDDGSSNQARGVYLLLDTSGTYTRELDKAQRIINYLLSTMEAGDSFAVARIDSASFSEKDIIAKATFDARPSVANQQKRTFAASVDTFIHSVHSSAYTDISGGILQGQEFLDESKAGHKYILIYSDLKEDLPKGYKRDFKLHLNGYSVIALNVTKLRSDNVDPKAYLHRVDAWQHRVEHAGARWYMINDLDREDALDLARYRTDPTVASAAGNR